MLLAMPLEQTAEVDEHPFAEVLLMIRLWLHMHKNISVERFITGFQQQVQGFGFFAYDIDKQFLYQ